MPGGTYLSRSTFPFVFFVPVVPAVWLLPVTCPLLAAVPPPPALRRGWGGLPLYCDFPLKEAFGAGLAQPLQVFLLGFLSLLSWGDQHSKKGLQRAQALGLCWGRRQLSTARSPEHCPALPQHGHPQDHENKIIVPENLWDGSFLASLQLLLARVEK